MADVEVLEVVSSMPAERMSPVHILASDDNQDETSLNESEKSFGKGDMKAFKNEVKNGLSPEENFQQQTEHNLEPVENGNSESDSEEKVIVISQSNTIQLSDTDRTTTAETESAENVVPQPRVVLQRIEASISISTPVVTPRKSNLKRPKSETPNSSSASLLTPSSKRIRIVENLETENSNNYIQLDVSSSPESLTGVDDGASITEVTSCGENMLWLNSSSSNFDHRGANVQFVRENLKPAKKKFSVEIDMKFTLSESVSALLALKTAISEVGATKFHLWISQNSIYSELKFVHKENFLKMANIDALLDFDLSTPNQFTNNSDSSVSTEENLYYVGDIWRRSKGFREYMLWRTCQNHQNFSTKILSIKTTGPPAASKKGIGSNTGILFREETCKPDYVDLAHLPTEMVEERRGFPESQDILKMGVLSSFINFFTSRTQGKGLHTLLVDNPEVSHVYESCREVRFQKYFYCQCILALKCLREGGTFVCKIFDTVTLFTNGLLFLLYKCFKSISIHKPASSPPFTTERFLICKGKLEDANTKFILDFLFDCLDMVINNQEQRKIVKRRVRKRLLVQKMEVHVLVPIKIILRHAEFFQFLRQSNIRLTNELAEHIAKLTKFMSDGDDLSLKELAKSLKDTQRSLLFTWNILPDDTTKEFHLPKDSLKDCDRFLQSNDIFEEVLKVEETKLESLRNISEYEQKFVAFPVQNSGHDTIFKSSRGLFYGCGNSKILHLVNGLWHPLDCPRFSLPARTLVIGEMVEEICVQGTTKTFSACFHLFDAVFLSGTYIARFPLQERQQLLKRFVQCLRNASSHINETFCVIPPLKPKEVTSFYRSTSHDFNDTGYHSGVRFYKTYVNPEEEQENWGILGGFLLLNSSEQTSPKNFFKNLHCMVSTWDSSGPNFQSVCSASETRLETMDIT